MGEFDQQEYLSRQQAAERLIDIAYTLAAGGPLEISLEGRLITIPVTNELRLERALKSERERVELRVVLTWSGPQP